MHVYEVGGAVRDRLLGLPVADVDWVVVGGTPDEMLRLGYTPVGRDFPVFLHPETKEEYALARTERKIAPGHGGFAFDTSPAVTLEEDLARRDLTINALARTPDGQVIDPWGGRADLERRLLRHVSAAFREDPLRVLRTARFAARFSALGFRIAPETLELMAQITSAGELATLSADRIWQETIKALETPRPDVFVHVLRACGALAAVFPEVDALYGVPQPPQWHPEIDTGVHLEMALELCARLSDSAAVRFAVLTHDLGKGTTPQNLLPRHHGHGERSAQLVERMAERLPVPKRFLRLALLVARRHGAAHRAFELRPRTVLELIEEADAFRDRQRFDDFLSACEADARGRGGLEERPYPQADHLRAALEAARAISVADLGRTDLEGPALGAALRRARLDAVREALRRSAVAADRH
jgi:tRNA nucleotidyltransferase (CCA-adding enzyme)